MSDRQVFVFMNEYSFRVEPGFVTAEKGDHLKFHNMTRFKVTLRFNPKLYPGKELTIPTGGKPERFEVPKLDPGFYPYEAAVEIGGGHELHAIGGSGPGVIIKP